MVYTQLHSKCITMRNAIGQRNIQSTIRDIRLSYTDSVVFSPKVIPRTAWYSLRSRYMVFSYDLNVAVSRLLGILVVCRTVIGDFESECSLPDISRVNVYYYVLRSNYTNISRSSSV